MLVKIANQFKLTSLDRMTVDKFTKLIKFLFRCIVVEKPNAIVLHFLYSF